MSYAEIYRKSIQQPEEFWADAAADLVGLDFDEVGPQFGIPVGG